MPFSVGNALRHSQPTLLALPAPRTLALAQTVMASCCKGVVVLLVVAADNSAVLKDRCSIYLSNVHHAEILLRRCRE